jgi:hypothetical protein
MACSAAHAAGTAATAGAHSPPASVSHHLTHHKKKHGHQLKRPHHKKSDPHKKRLQHRRRIHKRVSTSAQ